MAASLQLTHIERPRYSIDLFVPDAAEVQQSYYAQKQVQAAAPFPHWTRLWPAALALADLIEEQPEYVQGKQVLELAAGLGLPSFVAARYAFSVCCSDYLQAAVDTMQQSAKHLALSNVSCALLDWNDLPDELTADVLLLSDINYDPDQFVRLYAVLKRFLAQGTTVLLATPQRLMAKPFIEKLLPFCQQQYERMVHQGRQQGALMTGDAAPYTPVSLLVLKA